MNIQTTYSLSVQWGHWSGNTRPLGGHWFGGPSPPTEGRDAAPCWRRRRAAECQQGNPCIQSETKGNRPDPLCRGGDF